MFIWFLYLKCKTQLCLVMKLEDDFLVFLRNKLCYKVSKSTIFFYFLFSINFIV